MVEIANIKMNHIATSDAIFPRSFAFMTVKLSGKYREVDA
jgi:hypothetical protein